MSAPLRFIGLALFAWVGVRAASLGMFPGSTALIPPAAAASPRLEATAAQVSTPVPAEAFLPPGPVGYGAPQPYPYPPYPPYPGMAFAPRPSPATFVVPAEWGALRMRFAAARPPASAWDLVMPTPLPAEQFPDVAPLPFAAAAPFVPRASAAPAPPAQPPGPPKLDRLQLTSWALLRNGLGNDSLAQGGTLGGSQVGARLTYRFTPQIAASLRFSSSAGGVRGAEAAAGVRWQPLRAVPVAINLERREGLGRWGGRSDFAAFVEGGLYQRPIALGFALDAYAQAGMVGVKNGDWFADGSAALTRPLWRNLSAGAGVWAGGQSSGADSLYRIDAGPRLSYAVRRNVRLHLDYRQRLAGDALPRSGPALTIAGDF